MIQENNQSDSKCFLRPCYHDAISGFRKPSHTNRPTQFSRAKAGHKAQMEPLKSMVILQEKLKKNMKDFYE